MSFMAAFKALPCCRHLHNTNEKAHRKGCYERSHMHFIPTRTLTYTQPLTCPACWQFMESWLDSGSALLGFRGLLSTGAPLHSRANRFSDGAAAGPRAIILPPLIRGRTLCLSPPLFTAALQPYLCFFFSSF